MRTVATVTILFSVTAVFGQVKTDTLPDPHQLAEVEIMAVKQQSAAALRTPVRVQDIPQAVSIVGQRLIRQQAAFDLSAVSRNMTGLNFTGSYSGMGSTQFFNARGFDLNEAQNYRWNGVMIWNLGPAYADNIEQVEFLKGPNSILYGDVAPGGVLNLVTKKPLAEWMARAEFKTGSWGLVRPAVDVGGPLNAGKTVRFRLNSSYESRNSFRDRVSSEAAFVAPAVAWDITPKLSLLTEVMVKTSAATDDAGLVSPDGTLKGLESLDPTLYLGEPDRRYKYADQRYSTTLHYGLSRRWNVNVLGFVGNTINRPFGLWFDQPDASGDFNRKQYGYRQRSLNATISAELSGQFMTGILHHHLLGGVDYQSARYRLTNAGELSFFDTDNIYNPVSGGHASPEPASDTYFPYVSIIGRKGVFVQDQVSFAGDKFHVLLAARAGQTKQGNDYRENELPGTAFEGFSDNIVSKNVVTPRVGLVYKPGERLSLFSSWSNGYELNSPDVFALNYADYAAPPATISSQVEAGAKGNFLQRRLGASLSVFQIDKRHPYGYVYENPATPDYDRYFIYYQGHHRSRGVEMEVDGKPSAWCWLNAGLAYTMTRISDDPAYPQGNELPNAPKLSGNMWLNFEPAGRLEHFAFSTGLFYKSSFYSSLVNDDDLKIPASYTLDAAVAYSGSRWGLQLNATNLTNRVSYLNPWQFNLFDVKPLRQFIATATFTLMKTAR